MASCLCHVITLCVAVTSFLGHHVVRPEVLSSENEALVDRMLDHVMECRQIPGLSMAVVRGKEHKTFSKGVTSHITKEAVTSRTLFNAGSIVQAFTATLIAIVQQRSGNVVHADTPIQRLIGGELELSTPALTSQITLRDTLLHRTGLTTGSIAGLTGLPQAMSRADVIKNMKELPAGNGIRETFNYNKLGYTLAAHVAERLMTSTWEKLMRTHVFDRLLMSSTLVDASADDVTQAGFARAHVTEEGVLVEGDPSLADLGPLAPAGTMWTTAEDMVKALRLFNGDPTLFAQLQLPGPIMEELMTPQVLLPPGYRAALDRSSSKWPVSDFNVGAGMGFLRNVYRGFQVPWVPGTSPGSKAIVWVVPERSIGIYIAINGQKHSEMPLGILQALAYYTADLMLGFDPWIDQTSACSFPSPFAEPVEFPDVEFSPQHPDFALTDYIGRYSSPLLGNIYVGKSSKNNNGLAFSMSDVTGELLPEGGNVFRLFLGGKHKFMATPTVGKHPRPFARLFFEFKGPDCVAVKMPDSIFGGQPIHFEKMKEWREEL